MNRLPLRVLLAAASILITLLLIEIGYRGVLLARISGKLARPSFRAVSASLYEFDAGHGYRYVPGRSAVSVDIVGGRPAYGAAATVNRFGGLGPAPSGDSPVDILAFGDSFTANPLQPVSWTEVVSDAPEFDVLNLGRDGYGLLQMMHLAAARNRELKPDLMIVAFITEDLLRDRFWRTTVDQGGGTTIFISTTATPRPAPDGAAELALVEPAITESWLRALPIDHPETDPVFAALCDRYRSRARDFYSSGVRSPGRSLLLNRIRHGDPWHGLHPPARNPRTTLTSYADDSTFVADFRSIHVPMALVLLPKHGELQAGHHFVDGQSQSLLESLETLSGVPVIRLMDYLERDGDLQGLYLLPHDEHPSPRGARAFGEAMLRMLRERITIRDAD